MSSANAGVPPYHPLNSPGHLRCTDVDRDAVADMVRSAAEDGRLDLVEVDERIGAVYTAKTHGELAQIVADIVAPPEPERPGPPPPAAYPVYPVYVAYPPPQPGISDRTILPAVLLCFFLGAVGAHRFYVGKTGSAIGMIAACILTLGIVAGIWALVDLIVLIVGSFRDRDGRILRNWTERPQS